MPEMEIMEPTRQQIMFDVGQQTDILNRMLPDSSPFKTTILAMVHPQRRDFVENFLASRAAGVDEANAIAREFRNNTRRMQRFPEVHELRKAGKLPLMKANLDVGTLTNFAQITGGQALGYVSLDTQVARGTVRPNSFTLYQALHKTRAYQVVDYWAQATDTGGKPAGSAFASFASVGTGTLTTNAGKYLLKNINLKLMLDGRALTTALAAQNSFVDISAQENINAALTVLETANWASYFGDSSVFSGQFDGVYKQISGFNSGQNITDFQAWNNSYAAGQGWTPQQALFNLIYQWAGFITNYNQFGRITHAFMSPTAAGSLQGLATTLLNNIVVLPGRGNGAEPIVVNGDLQGMRTRFGEIQFPIDMYITARDVPVQAVLLSDGSNLATSSSPSPPATVTVAVSGANALSAWTSAYTASSGKYMFAVAGCDTTMAESTLTWATQVSGIATNGAYRVSIAGPASDATTIAYRVFRSGLTEASSGNPAAVRYIGTIAASGSGTVVFTDLNTKIPGSETIFLLDMDEQDNAIDWRFLLPLTKIELFAQNLYMPWAVTAIGGVRLRIPKFHGIINNYVGDNPTFNPLSSNINAVV